LDAGRDVSVVLDSSLRTIDAEHYVERPRRYRQPVGHRHARRQLPSHVNRHRAVLGVRVRLQPWRVARDRIFVSRVIDQFYRLRGICGDGPEAICLGELPLRKGQDIAPRVATVERLAVGILEYMIIRRRFSVVGVLDEFGDRRTLDDLVAPVPDIGEMDPVCRGRRPVRMRKVAIQDQLVCCLSAVTELGPVHIAIGEQAVEPVP
jgi:hypothetical protein